MCGQHLFEGFDLCVLKHQIVSRSRLKIDLAVPELLLCGGIMLGCGSLGQAAITRVMHISYSQKGRLLHSQTHL